MSATAEVAAFLSTHECFSSTYVGGRFVPVSTGSTFASVSPTSEEVIHQVPAGCATDIDAAVAAARAAFDEGDWGTQPGSTRAALLRVLAAKIAEHKDILAKIESLDMGKHIDDAAGDIDACCAIIEENAALADELSAKTVRDCMPILILGYCVGARC